MRRVPQRSVTITIAISAEDAKQFLMTPPAELDQDFIKADMDARIRIHRTIATALRAAMEDK